MERAIAAWKIIETAPPGIHNLEAPHTIALISCMTGMLGPTFYAAGVYWPPNGTSYSDDGRIYEHDQRYKYDMRYKFTPEVEPFREPFSALANLCYFTAGVGLFLMPFLSGDFMPAPTYAVALFLTVLGGASMAFHADASVIGTWEHAADRFAMFLVFAYLSVAVFNGLYHACKGVEQNPRSCCGLITNILGFTFATGCLVFQDHFDAMPFLLATGCVSFAANFFAICVLHVHRQAAEDAAGQARPMWKKLVHAALRTLPSLLTRVTCLGMGFYFNMQSAAYLEYAYAREAHVANDTAADFALRVEARRMHDVTHGSWHFMTAMVIMGLGLELCEGLSGSLRPPSGYRRAPQREEPSKDDDQLLKQYALFFSREHPYEVASMLISFAIAIIFAIIGASGASSSVWLAVWLAVVLVVTPFGIFALCKVVGAHNEHLRSLSRTAPMSV